MSCAWRYEGEDQGQRRSAEEAFWIGLFAFDGPHFYCVWFGSGVYHISGTISSSARYVGLLEIRSSLFLPTNYSYLVQPTRSNRLLLR